VLLCFDEVGLAQDLEVLGGVRQRERGLTRESVHGARPLAQQVQKCEARSARKGVTDPRKLLIEGIMCLHSILN
jgi:hypothetical protein